MLLMRRLVSYFVSLFLSIVASVKYGHLKCKVVDVIIKLHAPNVLMQVYCYHSCETDKQVRSIYFIDIIITNYDCTH